MGSIDDVLSGTGPDDTDLTQGPQVSSSDDYEIVLGYDPADYRHLGAAMGAEYDKVPATLVVRDIGDAATAQEGIIDAASTALAQVLPFPLGLVANAGLEIALSPIVFITDKLILTSAVEPRSARSAMVMSFNQPTVYTSGMQPYIFRYAGHVLINELDGDGRNQFYAAYREYLRASASLVGAERQTMPWVVELTFRDMFRAGYVVDLSMSINAAEPSKADISFTLFVIDDRFS